jgi:erythromycin esterase
MKVLDIPFRSLNVDDPMDDLVDAIGGASVVLLGEASHGTSEYYTWRARISRRLITEKGFRFVAVEGDWPDCYEINRFVMSWSNPKDGAREVLGAFERWPTWMWANWEMIAFASWLRSHNEPLPEREKVGFYGLDVYSLWESLDIVVQHFAQSHPEVLHWAEAAVHCLAPFERSGQAYAAGAYQGLGHCEDEVIRMLSALRREPVSYPDDPEAHFNAEHNAKVALGAERYYRSMVRADETSWNIRDRHMVETLDSLMSHHGPGAKAICWEHNTHVGDARATDMSRAGMVNVGQLVREQRAPGDVYVVGFGSYHGSVIAGKRWGAPMEAMPVPEAMFGSWEGILHWEKSTDKLVFSSRLAGLERFNQAFGHRAIGVVYNPEFEKPGNYVPSILPRRYDAFIYLDETSALHPLKIQPAASTEPPDMFPWGL